MTWPNIVGHDVLWQRLSRSVAQRRLASTFLFVGPPGIGKRTVALRLAQGLLCQTTGADELVACQTCAACQQIEAQTHPDLILIERPADRNFIPIELFIGDREHRMQIGLCHDISRRPHSGQRKVAIIDDADHLNQEGANCLLKTLEEPPGNSIIILIGTSQQRQLPTIRSRCQIVRFNRLTQPQLVELLGRLDGFEDPDRAASLATRADGSLRRALELVDEDLEQARTALLLPLSRADFDSVELTRQINQFVDAAGKDAPARRARLRQVLLAMVGFYRHVMRELAGSGMPRDQVTEQFVQTAQVTFRQNAPAVTVCLDRCFEAMNQLDANANLATLIACWLDDLAQATWRVSSAPSQS